jgi:hypothetical protein
VPTQEVWRADMEIADDNSLHYMHKWSIEVSCLPSGQADNGLPQLVQRHKTKNQPMDFTVNM